MATTATVTTTASRNSSSWPLTVVARPGKIAATILKTIRKVEHFVFMIFLPQTVNLEAMSLN
jgi:hypothetical protein